MPRRSPLIATALALLALGAFGFGAIGGGAALAAPQLAVTGPGQSTSWHPEKLLSFDEDAVRPGGTVTEQFAVENKGRGDMAIDVVISPARGSARFTSLTLRDQTAGKTLYEGPIATAAVRNYELGQGDGSRRVFEMTIRLATKVPSALSRAAASPGVSIESQRGNRPR